MANTKYANQIQLSAAFVTTNPAVVAIGDSVEVAIGKLQDQNFAEGEGTYISGWNAATNTPTLSNSTIETAGDWYNVTAAGTVNFGAGNITFALNDRCYSNGTTYQKGTPITSDIILADGQLLIGQTTGLGAGKTMSGQATITDQGVLSLAFGSHLTAGTFDGTIKGGGVQYFNTNINVAITDMVIGTPYILYNSHATDNKTITVTGAGAAVIGGDALTSSLVQTVNAGTGYTLTLQNATTVMID
jgi:hypothetical protein